MLRMIRQTRRRFETQRSNNQQEEVQTSEGQLRMDDVIREYVESLAAHGLRLEDVFAVSELNLEWVEVQRGLTPERIERFSQFNARASQISVTGNQCAVCLNDIQVGTRVLRLDCRHTFCATCILQWFVDKNTCPCCRRRF